MSLQADVDRYVGLKRHLGYKFSNNERMLRKRKPGRTDGWYEQEAARMVRDHMPTYSKIPRAVEFARRSPFVGSFVSFPAEAART